MDDNQIRKELILEYHALVQRMKKYGIDHTKVNTHRLAVIQDNLY